MFTYIKKYLDDSDLVKKIMIFKYRFFTPRLSLTNDGKVINPEGIDFYYYWGEHATPV